MVCGKPTINYSDFLPTATITSQHLISDIIVRILATTHKHMALRAGKIVRGVTGTYELLDALKAPTVYKAQVLSGPRINKRWYVSAIVLEKRQSLTLTIGLW
jgi:hypothetical protein